MGLVKQIAKIILVMLVVFIGLTYLANYAIEKATKNAVKWNVSELPACRTALLLGTSKTLRHKQPNAYYYKRIQATAELYHAGKVKYIIVSGDNSVEIYNEPADMKKDLIRLGVPDSVIYPDYAGFRTFDSVVRAREVFGQDSLIMISQQFHNQRAIYIARHFGITAYGYNAKDVDASVGLKTNVREFFARLKVFIDLYTNARPKFLGEKIKVGK